MIRNILSFILLLSILKLINALGEVIYAINAGGETHIDVYGIRYERDPLHDKVGTSSDYGKRLIIGRIPPGDQILYQTERYHHSTFGYEIPLKGDGEYVIVLKFCEVYFNSPKQKVFDVLLNGEIKVVHNLDIFSKVGQGVAHDEYVTFTVEGDTLNFDGQTSIIQDNKITVEFVKGYKDNPKINAIYVIKGRIEDVPKLPLLPRDEDLEGDIDEGSPRRDQAQRPSSTKRKPSGPRTPDPYAEDESSSLLPVFVAIGAALPLLFCLCRL
ncbi:UNVERIFIED_CONTAM: hypothetical protein RMT77_003626 [Armadillidium vulgare]|uniref:Malectin n=1 Tax=Armadillidium nasatum TaxID=96803 RepID=A0A5N5T941_9CRUS|nr:Malectin [Armadillidium nasatum]